MKTMAPPTVEQALIVSANPHFHSEDHSVHDNIIIGGKLKMLG
jgi:hypothetical protein